MTAAPSQRIGAVPHELEEVCRRYAARCASVEQRRLWAHVEATVRGGKQIRSELVFLGADLKEGSVGDVSGLAKLGCAFEFLHAALLFHDDVIDHDDLRRGELNVVGDFAEFAVNSGRAASAQNWGETAGILAGDLALSCAHQLVAAIRGAAQLRSSLMDLLDQAVWDSAAGELADVLANPEASIDQVIRTHAQKTARYSFQAPLQAGALFAGASDSMVETFGEVGYCLGVAYQLADDVIGLLASSDMSGKPVLSDLRELRPSAPLVHVRRSEYWSSLESIRLRERYGAAELAEVRRVLSKSGTLLYMDDLISSLCQTAQERWSGLDLSSEGSGRLEKIAASIKDWRSRI